MYDFTAGYGDEEPQAIEAMPHMAGFLGLRSENTVHAVAYAPAGTCHFCAGTTPARLSAEWKGKTYWSCEDHYETFRKILDGESWATGYEYAHPDLTVDHRPEIRSLSQFVPLPAHDPDRSGTPEVLLRSV